MGETYNQGKKGRKDSDKTTVALVTLPDSAARPAALQYHTRLGDQLLCQNLDGSMSYYTIDAERSTATDLIMRKV
jgi:hypothetical protein